MEIKNNFYCDMYSEKSPCEADDRCAWDGTHCFNNYYNRYKLSSCVKGSPYRRDYSRSGTRRSQHAFNTRGPIFKGPYKGKFRPYYCGTEMEKKRIPVKTCSAGDYNDRTCTYDPFAKVYKHAWEGSPRRKSPIYSFRAD